jgi:uncharacterized membrane protein
LLWYNNALLFWLTVVPFTTAFIGEYPTQPVVVAAYALNLCLAGASFTLMGHYAFFKGNLLPASVTLAERRREWYRSWVGTGFYGLAVILAFIYVYAALVVVALLPLFYVVPTLLGQGAAEV